MTLILLEMALFLGTASATCREVTADVIRMRDLSPLSPAFSVLNGDAVVSPSPLPGAVRVLRGPELARLAERNGIKKSDAVDPATFGDVCFQWAMREINEKDLLAALHQAMGIPDIEIDLADFSRFPAPTGELVFPRSGLALSSATTGAPVLWRGYVNYSGVHRFAIWAKVRMHARLNRVIATDNLTTGLPVRADQLRIEMLDGAPDTLAPAQNLDQVIGKCLLRPVHRGTTVSLDDLATARAVRRGDKVDVAFESPALHLRFEATAQADGHFGERIPLRNLQSGNLFTAEVSGKDQARVVQND